MALDIKTSRCDEFLMFLVPDLRISNFIQPEYLTKFYKNPGKPGEILSIEI
jgi:hypothetical protein